MQQWDPSGQLRIVRSSRFFFYQLEKNSFTRSIPSLPGEPKQPTRVGISRTTKTRKQEVDQLEGGGDQNVFRREFDRLDAGNGVVLIRDMPRLIEGALGRDTRPWIKDRILKMFEANRDGKISWLDLQDGLRKAVGATRSDVSYRERQVPEWLVFNRKVR